MNVLFGFKEMYLHKIKYSLEKQNIFSKLDIVTVGVIDISLIVKSFNFIYSAHATHFIGLIFVAVH